MQLGNGTFLHGDCLELMREIPDGSVDMVLCDLPYGTTSIRWDSVIPFDVLWEQYWRICKPNAAVVLTAAQPFTSALVMSQAQHFKYSWVWNKNSVTGAATAKIQPMRSHEDICVFYKSQCTYNPQDTPTAISDRKVINGRPNGRTGKSNHVNMGVVVNVQKTVVSPRTSLDFKSVPNSGGTKLHPTQKPVALFEYLIRTYTNPGDTVLDNTAGSGTTAIAAENAGRNWICMERDPSYYESAIARVWDHVYAA